MITFTTVTETAAWGSLLTAWRLLNVTCINASIMNTEPSIHFELHREVTQSHKSTCPNFRRKHWTKQYRKITLNCGGLELLSENAIRQSKCVVCIYIFFKSWVSGSCSVGTKQDGRGTTGTYPIRKINYIFPFKTLLCCALLNKTQSSTGVWHRCVTHKSWMVLNMENNSQSVESLS